MFWYRFSFLCIFTCDEAIEMQVEGLQRSRATGASVNRQLYPPFAQRPCLHVELCDGRIRVLEALDMLLLRGPDLPHALMVEQWDLHGVPPLLAVEGLNQFPDEVSRLLVTPGRPATVQ